MSISTEPTPPSESTPLRRRAEEQGKAGRVLFALGSERAPIRAIMAAHEFSRALGAELHVIRVVPPGAIKAAASSSSPGAVARALREAQRVIAAARHTRKLCDRILSEHLPAKQLCVRLGAFVEQVAQRAEEIAAVTIAIAPSNKQLAGAVLGLSARTRCNVLVPRACHSFTTLLAATDLEDERTPVLRQAVRLGQSLNANVVAFHSVLDCAPNGVAPAATLERRRASLSAALRGLDGRVEPIVLGPVDPARGILEQANLHDASLIVVGARSLRRSVSPSTAIRLLKYARRSVLVAPLGAGRAREPSARTAS